MGRQGWEGRGKKQASTKRPPRDRSSMCVCGGLCIVAAAGAVGGAFGSGWAAKEIEWEQILGQVLNPSCKGCSQGLAGLGAESKPSCGDCHDCHKGQFAKDSPKS